MLLLLICLLAVGVIAFAERSTRQVWFALTVQALLAAVFALILGDLDRAILLSALVTAAIAADSMVKYSHSGLKLVVTDLPLMMAGTVPFFIVQYPRAVASVVVGGIAAIVVALAIVLYAAGAPLSLDLRILLLTVAVAVCALTYRISGGAAAFRSTVTEPRGFFSSFMASLVDMLSWRQVNAFAISDIAREPLPLLPAVPARATNYPDVIVIQHESVFDPRLFGLPVQPVCDEFLAPTSGLHGSLHVDIYGGGSWQSEF